MPERANTAILKFKHEASATKKAVIKSMRRKDYTLAEIGMRLGGITRQRVQQLLGSRKAHKPLRVQLPTIHRCLSCGTPVNRRSMRCSPCAIRRYNKLNRLRFKENRNGRRDKQYAFNKSWAERNPERYRATQKRLHKKWRDAHREELNAKSRARYATDPKYRARIIAATKASYERRKARIKAEREAA